MFKKDALELERDEIVGRAWHNHHQQEEARQYRNGYGNPRCLTCGSGTIQLQMPRLRKAFDSKIVQKYERMTDAMKRLIPELYLHGLATGDFEYAFGWLLGENAPLSSSSILEEYQDYESNRIIICNSKASDGCSQEITKSYVNSMFGFSVTKS